MIYFSNNLKFLREGRGKKQSELAQSIGVKPNTVSNYEKGVSQPDYDILKMIIELFNVSADEILYSDLTVVGEKSRSLNNIKITEVNAGDSTVINRLFDSLSEKDSLIRKQAEEIGMLKQQVKQRAEKNTDAAGAICANVG